MSSVLRLLEDLVSQGEVSAEEALDGLGCVLGKDAELQRGRHTCTQQSGMRQNDPHARRQVPTRCSREAHMPTLLAPQGERWQAARTRAGRVLASARIAYTTIMQLSELRRCTDDRLHLYSAAARRSCLQSREYHC